MVPDLKPLLRILVLGNGAAGAEKQALALASRLRRSFREDKQVASAIAFARVELRKGFQFVPASAQIFLSRWLGDPWLGYRSEPSDSPACNQGFNNADVVIGCGRSTASICARLQTQTATSRNPFRIQIQHPRTSLDYFDAVVTPRHDWRPHAVWNPWRKQLTLLSTTRTTAPLPNVNVPDRLWLTHGTVYDLNSQQLDQELTKWTSKAAPHDKSLVSKYLTASGACRLVLLVGGPCRGFAFSEQTALEMCRQLLEVTTVMQSKAILLVTFSRRTPPPIQRLIRQELGRGIPNDQLFIWNGQGENPFLVFLSCATAIVTTPDSISMTTEAIASGRKVFVLRTSEVQGKFRVFHEHLLAAGFTHRFESLSTRSCIEKLHQPQASCEQGAIQLEQELQRIVSQIAHQILQKNRIEHN